MKFSVNQYAAIVAGLKLLQNGLAEMPGFYTVRPDGEDEISRELHDNFQCTPLTGEEIADLIDDICD